MAGGVLALWVHALPPRCLVAGAVLPCGGLWGGIALCLPLPLIKASRSWCSCIVSRLLCRAFAAESCVTDDHDLQIGRHYLVSCTPCLRERMIGLLEKELVHKSLPGPLEQAGDSFGGCTASAQHEVPEQRCVLGWLDGLLGENGGWCDKAPASLVGARC